MHKEYADILFKWYQNTKELFFLHLRSYILNPDDRMLKWDHLVDILSFYEPTEKYVELKEVIKFLHSCYIAEKLNGEYDDVPTGVKHLERHFRLFLEIYKLELNSGERVDQERVKVYNLEKQVYTALFD